MNFLKGEVCSITTEVRIKRVFHKRLVVLGPTKRREEQSMVTDLQK